MPPWPTVNWDAIAQCAVRWNRSINTGNGYGGSVQFTAGNSGAPGSVRGQREPGESRSGWLRTLRSQTAPAGLRPPHDRERCKAPKSGRIWELRLLAHPGAASNP